MKPFGIFSVLSMFMCCEASKACTKRQSLTFSRWSGVSPEDAPPVFVYSASGDEASLTGACLARCRELDDCAAVAVAYGQGSCHGFAKTREAKLSVDSDVGYFQKVCLDLPQQCVNRWWALESTPGYHLHAEGRNLKVMLNTTVQDCYAAVLASDQQLYRSAQWVGQGDSFDPELIRTSDTAVGSCILNAEDKFTEPESYRVANYQTLYIESQCRHDYSKKIDRCSYEEYYNQTLKHVEFNINNFTKDECKSACEIEDRFICRGFTWGEPQGRGSDSRGVCDLHSEDLVSTGSWLLRRSSFSTFYRRVICLNITVECSDSDIVVSYRPRGVFRGRVYVAGRGERCSARSNDGLVSLKLPLYGDCDVHFAHAITYGPQGIINRKKFNARRWALAYERTFIYTDKFILKTQTMAYVMVMIQNNPIIQTAGDRWVRVGCTPGASKSHRTQVDATIAVRDTGKPSVASETPNISNPASASAVLNTPVTSSLTMYVVRAHETPNTTPQAALGEPLELRVETQDDNEIEAYHLVASSRLGDSSVLLLDSRGCPTGQVDFPAMSRSWLGSTQRLSARFKAFRFPTSHVVRFALMVRYCDGKCPPANCQQPGRATRGANDTSQEEWPTTSDAMVASIREDSNWAARLPSGVVAQGGRIGCGGNDNGKEKEMELEIVVGSRDMLSADTLVRADHRSTQEDEARMYGDTALVCVHELLLVALALAWLAVQILLLLGCCVLVKRYRNLAEMSMQKDYHSFDNVGFDTGSTHRRVHWPDQTVDILHTT